MIMVACYAKVIAMVTGYAKSGQRRAR